MTLFMLDTDTVSFWLRGEGSVGEHLRDHSPSEICISAITVQEIELGIARRRSKRLRRSVDAFYAGIRIAPYDHRAARAYGPLARGLLDRGLSIGLEDTMIAAHAVALDATLVTHNIRHFRRVPRLRVEDWY